MKGLEIKQAELGIGRRNLELTLFTNPKEQKSKEGKSGVRRKMRGREEDDIYPRQPTLFQSA